MNKMVKLILCILGLSFIINLSSFGQNDKEQFIQKQRLELAKNSFKLHDLDKKKADKLEDCIRLLEDDGVFNDLRSEEQEIKQRPGNNDWDFDKKIDKLSVKAFLRLWRLSEAIRDKEVDDKNGELKQRILKAFINYGKIETGRMEGGSRFHSSCFLIPRAVINCYFCFFDDMESVEKGNCKDETTIEAHKYIQTVGMQAWTQPIRNDETDKNVVDVERFRGHVWWVGGNALGYRSLFECAIMLSSIEMIDVLAEVSKKALSSVSQATYDEAFWIEGFTADGAGWGHGKQCLIWGYPIHGTSPALSLLSKLYGTPWSQELERENVDEVLNYIRGSAFYFYKGVEPPCLSRGAMTWYGRKKLNLPSVELAQNLVNNWESSLTKEEYKELQRFIKSSANFNALMSDYPKGHYHGTRYFFNNDNLIKKEKDYYAYISMASSRCDGIESAHSMADAYNLFTCDGMTLFERTGEEYREATGGWNLTAIPGVTSRQGEEHLVPITNWGGFNSKYNFAGAATHGGENACAGFKFLKNNTRGGKGKEKNEFIFGVDAQKGYFWFGDNLLALGAGVTNLKAKDYKESIWTTIDQTIVRDCQYKGEKVSPKQGTNKVNIARKDANWIINNGFAYHVIQEQTNGKVYFSVENRLTKWNKLSPVNKKIKGKPEQVEIFQLWIDHGNKPVDATYAYVVNCKGQTPTELPTVLSNTKQLQAAISADKKTVEAVFYNPEAELNDGSYTYKVSSECVLMVEDLKDSYQITICDPCMNTKLKSIQITTSLPVVGTGITLQNGVSVIDVPLYDGKDTGRPVSVNVKKK
ncbi:MAG: polysaccharide lyase beta-sandwich domain-containing protein [Carboxylicivirga sp.]|nr:polysaccharide lyase beta-sandwich domain-containing protein [Carboxylicivirga sp.]